MASYKEMHELGRDRARVRMLAYRLLASQEDWTDWGHDFLESLAAHYGSDALTTRQQEKLVELRDGAEFVSRTPQGFSVSSLIESCWLRHLDLVDEDDIGFIEGLKGERSIRRRQLGRLLRCCRQLDVIDG